MKRTTVSIVVGAAALGGIWVLVAGVGAEPEDGELKKELTSMQYEVTQEDGTEPPFRNEYWDNEQPGIYVDVVSGEPLFSSEDKFESGTGWPSFTRPLVSENIVTREDRKLLSVRTEVRSEEADSHLGHVFEDGPEPTGLRYCVNSAALRFIPAERLEAEGYGRFADLFEGAAGDGDGDPEGEKSAGDEGGESAEADASEGKQ